MSGEELLGKADEALDRKGWCTNRLYEAETGAHCALGSIGYAKWGEEFNRAAQGPNAESMGPEGNGAKAYQMLGNDPEGQEAIRALAAEIRSKSLLNWDDDPRPLRMPGIPADLRADMGVVMFYNDRRAANGSVRIVFKGLKARWQARLKAMLPKKQEVVTEHVAAPVARPIRTANIEHAEGVEVHE